MVSEGLVLHAMVLDKSLHDKDVNPFQTELPTVVPDAPHPRQGRMKEGYLERHCPARPKAGSGARHAAPSTLPSLVIIFQMWGHTVERLTGESFWWPETPWDGMQPPPGHAKSLMRDCLNSPSSPGPHGRGWQEIGPGHPLCSVLGL